MDCSALALADVKPLDNTEHLHCIEMDHEVRQAEF